MLKRIFLISSCLAIVLAAASFPLTVWAADSIITPDNDPSSTYNTGDYSLNDIMAIVISVSGWILGIVGSLALLMFVYGGFMFLISAGSSDKIGQAQKILVAAVIGLAIVFCSYMIIRFVAQTVGVDWQGGKIISANDACSKKYPGYSCMDKNSGTDCHAGYCLLGSDRNQTEIQCCK